MHTCHESPSCPERTSITSHRRQSMRFSRALPTLGEIRGWSLVETLVVVAIMMTLAAWVTPELRQMVNRHRLIGMAQVLRSDVQQARALAVQHQAPVHLRLVGAAMPSAGGSGYLLHLGQVGDCQFNAQGQAQCASPPQLLRQVWWPATQRVSLQANVGSVSFNPRQGAVTPTGSVDLLAPGGMTLRQVIGVSGRIRSCSPDAGLIGYPAC